MSGLELDHETHTYNFGGKPIAGVSEILCALGIIDRSWFTDWPRDRGKAVHLAIQYHLEGDLENSSIDSRIKGYFDGAVKFLKDADVKPGPGTYVERPIYNALQRYAGCPDLVCTAFGELAVPDFKTGGLGQAGIQTALYEMAARTVYKAPAPMRRMGVQLFENGTYKKTDLRDGFDYAHGRAAVQLFNRFHLPRKQRGVENAA